MTMDFSPGNVLEHVQLNNMILAAKEWGVLDGLAVSQRGAGANMSVDVASGDCRIDYTKYTEASTVNLAIDASHATLYRKDLITYDPGTSNPVVTKGTDHAGGTGDPIYPPDIPAGDILLAIVDVDAAVTTIVNADVHDGRIFVGPMWMYVGTQVFSGSSSTSWTDLDLSSVVGSNRALVVLKCENTSATDDMYFSFRPNGDTDEYYESGLISPSSFEVGNSKASLATVLTDGSGIIEWRSSATRTCVIDVMSYVQLTA